MRRSPFSGPKLAGTVLLAGAWAAVLAARLWRLGAAPLPDYDAARSWLNVQELAQGNWAHLFHHVCPTWLLLHVPLAAWLGANYHHATLLNALVSVAGAALLARVVARWAPLPRRDEALLLLLIGGVTQYTFAGRDFAITAPALLILGLALNTYARRVRARSRAALLLTAAILAVGYTINYKVFLLLPGVVWLEWRQRADGVLRWSTALGMVGLLAAPLAGYALLADAVGLPWYRLPATWAAMVWNGSANAAGHRTLFGGDGAFYTHYLLRFESPLLLLGLGAGPWLARRAARMPGANAAVTLPLVLTGLAGAMLFFFGLVVKAPRGLVFALGPLAALGALTVYTVVGPTRRWLARLVLLAVVAGQASLLWREIGRYAAPGPAAHARVARWLHYRGVRRVATTAGLALAPEAARWSIGVTAATTPAALAAARRTGIRYVLLDSYRYVAGLDRVGAELRGRSVLRLTEPALLPPLLFLEHAEFTGESFNATLERQQRAAREPWQLVLLDTRPYVPAP